MMTRKQTEHPAAEAAAQDEDQAGREVADPGIPEHLPDSAPSADMTATAVAMRATAADTPLPSTAPAADLATAAEELRDRGIARIEGAEVEQADADAQLAKVLERLAAERAQAEAEHRQRFAGAARDKSGGEHDVLRSGWLANAAQERAEAAELDAGVADLEAERAVLLEQLAGLSERLRQRAEERRQLGERHEAALEADDEAEITDLSGKISTADARAARAESDRTATQARLSAIGDSEGGLLGETRQRASSAHGTVARMLRDVWPDSPEAARWREDQELQQAVDALRSYGRAEPQQPQRQIVARTAGH